MTRHDSHGEVQSQELTPSSPLDTRPAGTPAIDIGQITSGFEERVLFIPDAIRQLATTQHGTVATLTFKLSDPIQGRNVDSVVYIDDIRLSNAGQPLQVESVAAGAGATQGESQTDLSPVIEAAQLEWAKLVNMPNWSGWVTPGNVGSSATKLSTVEVNNVKENGNAGIGEGGFDDQLFFTNIYGSTDFTVITNKSAGNLGVGSHGSGFSYSALITDQIGSDRHTPLSTYGHSIESQDYSLLLQGQHAILSHAVVDEHATSHPNIGDGGAAVDGLAVTSSVTDFNVGLDLASPGGNGPLAGIKILKLEKLPLPLFPSPQVFGGEFDGFVGPHFFTSMTAGLGQDEDQQNHDTLQHNLSFGTLTLPPDRDSVNTVAGNGQWSMANGQLAAAQLALLNKATITIADLADGYLALTLGTTITLDTDAAGYGWFIDPSPLTNEEFVSGGSMVDGQCRYGVRHDY